MIFPFYKVLDDSTTSNTVEFDSVFESGNLAMAIKVSDTEYNCLLQNDINTNGHTQWFYFKCKSCFKKKTSVKINLLNLYKPKSLFQYGMRVLTLDVTQKDPINPPPPVGKDKLNKNVESTASTDKSAGKDDDDNSKLPLWERSCKDIVYI